MALGSTQPLVKMRTRNIPGGKGGRCVRLTTPTTFMCRMSWKFGSLNLLEPSGPHLACYDTPLPFTVTEDKIVKPKGYISLWAEEHTLCRKAAACVQVWLGKVQ